MTDTDTIDPELEDRARELLTEAVAGVRPSAVLDELVGALAAGRRSGSEFRWIAAAAAIALLAGGLWVVGDDGPRSSDVEVRDEPVEPVVDRWWTAVGTEWTDLPAFPSDAVANGPVVTATDDTLAVWLPTLGESTTTRWWHLEDGAWTGSELISLVSDHAVVVDSPDGQLLVADGPAPPRGEATNLFEVAVRLLASQSRSGLLRIGPFAPVDSYLLPRPALLPIPMSIGGGAAVFSHGGGSSADGLGVLRVTADGSELLGARGFTEVPNLRPLAVGASPDGEPVVLTQAIDRNRLPSMLVAWALTADGAWVPRGSATFGEADARWAGDRFVVVTNQQDAPRGSAAVELVLGPDGSDTSWRALADPGIGSCEGPVELVSDEQGGVVATSCNRSAYLAPGESKWKPVPESADGWNIPLAMWDGRLVAQIALGSGAAPSARLRAIDLRLDR